MTNRTRKRIRKTPRGVFTRGGVVYIRFQDETGRIVRESTKQQSLRLGEKILAKRKTEVADKTHFLKVKFQQVMWSALLDKWWKTQEERTPSFSYLLPRLRGRFGKKKAKDITSDEVQSFLDDLRASGLSASSVNHYRTIMNSVFNFAIKWKLYDENPVRAVHQIPEPPGRERFTTPEDVQKILDRCDEIGDAELKAFVVIASTTGMRKGEILPRTFGDLHLNDAVPYIYVPKTKNGSSKNIPLPSVAIEAIRRLPRFGKEDYVFPARANVRYSENFKKPHAWDLGKRFRRVCRDVGITDLRIHDLRHFAATTLFLKGVPEAIIAKMTGHKSRELRRYEHLSPVIKQQTVELIAGELKLAFSDSATDTAQKSNRASSSKSLIKLAEPTGFEPATSDVTGRRSNQLNYDSA